MDTEEDLEKWCQMYVLYLTGTVICPTTYQQASMKYAGLLSSDSLGELIDYNWCGHVLKHMHDGLVEAQTKKSLNVDLHLIMICMCEKFGSVASRPTEIIPLCGEWGTSNSKKEWETIEAKTISCTPLGKEIEFPVFRPGTKVDLAGLNDDDISRLKEWILGIRASCDAQLSSLNEFVRAKQVPTTNSILILQRWETIVHKNIKLACLEAGLYGEEATDIIHSPDWMSRYKDITDCEFWFFPILYGEHYRMIIVDIKQKRFQFFDSKSTADFESRWQATGARVVLYIKEYYAKFKSQVDFKKFKWETIKGITQRSGTESCGDYILRMMVRWMGKVEIWMHKKWRDDKEIDQVREQITLDVFRTSWNT
ncbi:hypothetical protein LINPERHAP2_LOCUS147 [Linum perenne]